MDHIYYAIYENALVPYEIEPVNACIYYTELLSDYLHKGYGIMMFDYMKPDLKKQGFKGIMVPATDFKEWMRAPLYINAEKQIGVRKITQLTENKTSLQKRRRKTASQEIGGRGGHTIRI